MDDLLHRLRHDMVELSSQGDNFTQQIWLMYGQFEQVVDRFNWPVETRTVHHPQLRHSPIRHRRRHRRRPNNPNTKMNNNNMMGSSSTTTSFASDSESDSEMMEVPKMMGGLSRHGVYSSRSGSKGLNPLLDTISVIGDLCDSDDAVDGPSSGALYAGSNSVDSGYKSSCPTPDCLIQDANNYIRAPPPVLPKSRRTLPAVPLVNSSANPEGSTAVLDLDHLTSLRRTLLTAIERYDTRTKELIDRELSSSSGVKLSSIHPADHHNVGTDDETENERGLLCKAEETEPQQDGATRFSRVAHCMLEIIEDLQRQQQQQQQSVECNNVAPNDEMSPPVAGNSGPVVPPKPSRISLSVATTTPAPATPPRVARRGRRKLPTPTQMIAPSPPSSIGDSGELTGADYHLYEEIIYDLGSSKTSIHSNLALNQSNEKLATNCCPPPLPARPSRPANPTTVGSCLSNSVKPWLNVIKPLRRDRNNQLIRNNNTTNSCSSLSSCSSSSSQCWTSSQMANKLNGHHTDVARSNVYTFGSHPQSHPPVNHPPVIKPQAFHPLPANSSSLVHRSSALHEDEYGFRAVSHMV